MVLNGATARLTEVLVLDAAAFFIIILNENQTASVSGWVSHSTTATTCILYQCFAFRLNRSC
jgi:hypothetical protein